MKNHCKANPCCGAIPCEGVPLPQHRSGLWFHNSEEYRRKAGQLDAPSPSPKMAGDVLRILQDKITDAEADIQSDADAGERVDLFDYEIELPLNAAKEIVAALSPQPQEHVASDIADRSTLWNFAIEACAALIEKNIIMDTSAGKVLAPRQDGNRDGLHYATAIRALTTEDQSNG